MHRTGQPLETELPACPGAGVAVTDSQAGTERATGIDPVMHARRAHLDISGYLAVRLDGHVVTYAAPPGA